MQSEFWHQKWTTNDIGFHEGKANALLVRHFDALSLPRDGRVFVPLCGKSHDMHWLLEQGHRVAGAELSGVAVEQLFAELEVQPTISELGAINRYSAPSIDIFVGDVFHLSKSVLGPIDAIYDRAALVALPADMRVRYANHLMTITDSAPQLVICFEYDQRVQAGPPFSIGDDEVVRHYGAAYTVTRLACEPVTGGLKGKCPAQETVWLLK